MPRVRGAVTLDARVAAGDRRMVTGVRPAERRDAAVEPIADHFPGDVGDVLGREAELLEDRPGRRRRAEVVEPDDRALVADPALPAEWDPDLDADPLADV